MTLGWQNFMTDHSQNKVPQLLFIALHSLLLQNCDADLGHVTQMLDTRFSIEGGILGQRFISKGANGLFLTTYSQKISQIGQLVAELWPFCEFCTLPKKGHISKCRKKRSAISRLPVDRVGWNFGCGLLIRIH